MDLCFNTFVIQFLDNLLDTCLLTVCRALLLRYAHRRHRKDGGSYKECWSHVESSISLTRNWTASCNPFLCPWRHFAGTPQEVNRDSGATPYPKISIRNYMSYKALGVAWDCPHTLG